MALLVNGNYETPQGITVNSTYWRWVGFGVEVPKAAMNVVLYAYASEAAFNAGKTEIGQKSYPVSGQQFGELVMQAPVGETVSDVLSNAIYAYVREHDEYFATATDV